MDRQQIVKEVLVRMNEASPLDGINIVPNPIVVKLLDESARNILLTAPLQLLPLTPFVSANKVGINSAEVSVGQIKLPDKFLRLVRFRLDSWLKPTHKVIQEGSETYKKQFNKYQFGGNARPVVTVVTGDLGLSLEYYFKKGTAPTIIKADCVVEIPAEQMPDILLVPLFWYTAGAAFQVLEMKEAAAACFERVKEQYNILTNAQ